MLQCLLYYKPHFFICNNQTGHFELPGVSKFILIYNHNHAKFISERVSVLRSLDELYSTEICVFQFHFKNRFCLNTDMNKGIISILIGLCVSKGIYADPLDGPSIKRPVVEWYPSDPNKELLKYAFIERYGFNEGIKEFRRLYKDGQC